ncbi:MAG: aspartate--tRNA ligase, partial [Candidatus Omnitrophota bacterium]
MLRTHTCGELNKAHIGNEVSLAGWVNKRRDHGDLIFIDVRDAYGLTQLVFDPQKNRDMHEKSHELKSEYVIQVKGTVRERPEGTKNLKLSTGSVEILVKELEILNSSLTPPFEMDTNTVISEEARLKFRYLDLRKSNMQKAIRLRHKVNSTIRKFLEQKNFVEIETPFLTKSTPEGARDYLVPSRLAEGKFYALPQSPQLFKQILMVAGFDRYFQIVRCFRDEDLRSDRQPEFTQLDMEMSFVSEEDIFKVSEELLKNIYKDAADIDISIPFDRLTHAEAMERYGTDKPDRRFGMELVSLTDIFKNTEFNVFKKNLASGGVIYAINVKNAGGVSRSEIDKLTQEAKDCGAKGLAYFKCENGKLSSNIDKFFDKKTLDSVKAQTDATDNDLILIVADKRDITLNVLGSLRLFLAKQKNLIDIKKHDLVWVTDFPLFRYNEEEKRMVSEHHPFTAYREEDASLLDKGELDKIKARSYDLVINGMEIASGSIRIHRRDIQEKIFKIIGLDAEEAKKRFGFLLEAFKYGAPPHGGIAFGLDRFVTIFTGTATIRDVIAFPKTQKGMCLMTGAPSDVDDKQLKELHIKKVK